MTTEEAIRVLEEASDGYFRSRRYPERVYAIRSAIKALNTQQEAEKNEPLTMAELLEIPGEPVWCAEYQCYGIVKVETVGCWANKPFLVGSWHDPKYGTAVDFEYDIKNEA